MSLTGATSLSPVLGFPRVSGDEPLERVTANLKSAFSPRERG